MADEKPSKNDIAAIFKRLRAIPANKVCFDCGAKNPTWASVTYGVFICMDCSAVHRSLGVHLSFVRSTQLDINWTWLQLRAMQVGGNSNALSFFQQHGCTSADAQHKYNSRAAQLYREKIHHQATAAIRQHGTKLHIDTPHAESPHSPEPKDVDFFNSIAESHSLKNANLLSENVQNGSPLNSSLNSPLISRKDENELCPKLEAALNISPSESPKQVDAKKSAIVSRKPMSAKKGPGSKKGLGAQKVSTNFSDIEKEAQKIDEIRSQENEQANKSVESLSVEDEEKQRASIRLAYKDLSARQKETEEKLRQTDPRKAAQLERLGMGFGTGGNRTVNNVAHSAASEMKLIAQEAVTPPSKNRDLDLDDDFEFFNFTSGPPKYGDSPFLSRSASGEFSSKGSWNHEKREKKSPSEIIPPVQKDVSSGRSRKIGNTPSPVVADEAQRKFGNAKAISSDQFFGSSKDTEFERKANLSRFEGSNSISSEDFFGSNSSSQRSMSSSFSGPNLYEIKEGVRDGVTKVAGRLSSIANGVMSSLQRK